MSEIYHFHSTNNNYNMIINSKLYTLMKDMCQKANSKETGGILIGTYSEDHTTAIITKVIGPPVDSECGPTWFSRGTEGLQDKLDKAWFYERTYYLGEWHYHPKDSPQPSIVDIKQMQGIATDVKYNCPEPILIIVNGDDKTTLKPYVFPKEDKHIPLQQLY